MFLFMVTQGASVQSIPNSTLQAAVVTSVGLVVVALIGIVTARVTTGAKRGAKKSSESAAASAKIAKEYAEALKSKDAFIDSLKERLEFVEKRLDECEGRREIERSAKRRQREE